MRLLKAYSSKVVLLFFSLLLALQALAISSEMKQTVLYETQSNAVSHRSAEKIMIENYEIPMSLVESDVAKRIDPQLMKSIVFEKKGKKYIRWIINPEDTKWYKEVEALLQKNDLPTTRHRFFEAYQTASRSYILVNPDNGVEFSAKVSTNKTGGSWRDKKQTYEDAWQIRMVTDYAQEAIKKTGALENVILLDEPAIFGLKAIDHGMVIREYGKLARSGNSYVPGFSIMHAETGRRLAKINGSNDPAAYWNEHYNKPLARAIAEFAALTGMTYDSPHSQNFLVELDKNMRPTGKIVLRDFGDTYLTQEYFDALGRSDIPARWELDNVKKGYLEVNVGILHGNKAPSWMDIDPKSKAANSYIKWGEDFYKEFDKEFFRQTGVSLKETSSHNLEGMYFLKTYRMNGSAGTKFLDLVRTGQQRAHLTYGTCRKLFN